MNEPSHIGVATAGELVSCHPLESVLDIIVINEDEFLSLAKAFGDKRCQPIWVKRKVWHIGGFPSKGTIVL